MNCIVCRDMMCGCREHYSPGKRTAGMAQRFGLCRSCADDVAKFLGEQHSNPKSEGGRTVARTGDQLKAGKIYDWLAREATNARAASKDDAATSQGM